MSSLHANSLSSGPQMLAA